MAFYYTNVLSMGNHFWGHQGQGFPWAQIFVSVLHQVMAGMARVVLWFLGDGRK